MCVTRSSLCLNEERKYRIFYNNKSLSLKQNGVNKHLFKTDIHSSTDQSLCLFTTFVSYFQDQKLVSRLVTMINNLMYSEIIQKQVFNPISCTNVYIQIYKYTDSHTRALRNHSCAYKSNWPFGSKDMFCPECLVLQTM